MSFRKTSSLKCVKSGRPAMKRKIILIFIICLFMLGICAFGAKGTQKVHISKNNKNLVETSENQLPFKTSLSENTFPYGIIPQIQASFNEYRQFSQYFHLGLFPAFPHLGAEAYCGFLAVSYDRCGKKLGIVKKLFYLFLGAAKIFYEHCLLALCL